jgi:D-arabinono-1,4-lactone oxidase
VMLDRYRGWRVVEADRRLVEADAGIHLGANPSDPTGAATLETSLLARLAEDHGWTLFDTGGITHQTVSGFVSTGSSGGSLRFTSNENLHGIRVIDGRGDVHDFSRDDPDPDAFHAMAPALGLLGVISKITFACTDLFAIEGEEATTTIDGAAIDLLGAGDGRPSLEQFLRDAEFARVEWWPQRGFDRVVTWQARRRDAGAGFEPRPYKRFGDDPEANQHLIGILYTILGNLDDLARARNRLDDSFRELEAVLARLRAARDLGVAGQAIAAFVAQTAELGVDAAITALEPLVPLIRRELPDFFPKLVSLFVTLDDEKPGRDRGEPQRFADWGWCGLPMDNAVNDVVVPTEFTEAWVPLPRTAEAMNLLAAYFREPRDDHEAYRRTGTYAWELYAAMPDRFWLSPSYSSGDDEWREGAFRIDPYWFADSAADPSEALFAGLWTLLRDNEVPFRLHWGKFQPTGDDWVEFFRGQYPRWDDFLALRAERDPNNIFLTDYWRDRFGLQGEPAPRPVNGSG